eukprot:gb/GECH01005718.1/.p1 GENE.gb/GECH01005718.1/~~gb/GECH01005718.1/.p1  ORF type:complete len:1252 (+),score=281.43 gb/GECH01005718.1/:1-3756(+)
MDISIITPTYRRARVLYDFEPEFDEELSVEKGDMVMVNEELGWGWTKCIKLPIRPDSTEGCVPLAYLRDISFMDTEKASSIIFRAMQRFMQLQQFRRFLSSSSELYESRVRKTILSDFEQTEGLYIRKLFFLKYSFLDPLRERKKLVDPATTHQLFNNCEQLLEIHKVLQSTIKEHKSKGKDLLVAIADSLEYAAPTFKMYSKYINNYSKAKETLDRLLHNKKFLAFVKEQQKGVQGGFTLDHLLACPMERMTYYVGMMRDLLAKTPPHHTAYDSLVRALDSIEKTFNFVSERKRLEQSNATILALREKLAGRYDLLKPGRQYVREGRLKITYEEKDIDEEWFRVYLFNDLLILLSEDDVYFVLFFAFSTLVGTEYRASQREFYVETYQRGGRVAFVFIAESVAERKEWEAEVGRLIREHNINVKTHQDITMLEWDAQWDISYEDDLIIDRKIGQGTFGYVYQGRWKAMESVPVAIKMMRCQTLDEDDESWREFKREINMMRKLSHPNIVELLTACSTPPNICMVTEFASRGNLKNILRNKRLHLSWEDCWRYTHDVAAGMAHLHRQDPPIIHRDLKAENLLLFADGRIKVADFGFAKVRIHTVTMTQQAGTPFYMAPEILQESKSLIGTPCDVYSFGIVMWEILTRKKLYADLPWTKVTMQVCEGKRPALPAPYNDEEYLHDHPHVANYIRLMQRCWAQHPEDRPTFDDVLHQLHDCKTGHIEIVPAPDPIWVRRRRHRKITLRRVSQPKQFLSPDRRPSVQLDLSSVHAQNLQSDPSDSVRQHHRSSSSMSSSLSSALFSPRSLEQIGAQLVFEPTDFFYNPLCSLPKDEDDFRPVEEFEGEWVQTSNPLFGVRGLHIDQPSPTPSDPSQSESDDLWGMLQKAGSHFSIRNKKDKSPTHSLELKEIVPRRLAPPPPNAPERSSVPTFSRPRGHVKTHSLDLKSGRHHQHHHKKPKMQLFIPDSNVGIGGEPQGGDHNRSGLINNLSSWFRKDKDPSPRNQDTPDEPMDDLRPPSMQKRDRKRNRKSAEISNDAKSKPPLSERTESAVSPRPSQSNSPDSGESMSHIESNSTTSSGQQSDVNSDTTSKPESNSRHHDPSEKLQVPKSDMIPKQSKEIETSNKTTSTSKTTTTTNKEQQSTLSNEENHGINTASLSTFDSNNFKGPEKPQQRCTRSTIAISQPNPHARSRRGSTSARERRNPVNILEHLEDKAKEFEEHFSRGSSATRKQRRSSFRNSLQFWQNIEDSEKS